MKFKFFVFSIIFSGFIFPNKCISDESADLILNIEKLRIHTCVDSTQKINFEDNTLIWEVWHTPFVKNPHPPGGYPECRDNSNDKTYVFYKDREYVLTPQDWVKIEGGVLKDIWEAIDSKGPVLYRMELDLTDLLGDSSNLNNRNIFLIGDNIDTENVYDYMLSLDATDQEALGKNFLSGKQRRRSSARFDLYSEDKIVITDADKGPGLFDFEIAWINKK
jgi:hypothetical protein